jgi:hypothetical protein
MNDLYQITNQFKLPHRLATPSVVDFWSIFGEGSYWIAIIPCAIILVIIGLTCYKNRKKDSRIALFSYSALLTSLIFFASFQAFRIYSVDNRNRIDTFYQSSGYTFLTNVTQFLIFQFLISFIFLMFSINANEDKLKRIHSTFIYVFPSMAIFISWFQNYWTLFLSHDHPGLYSEGILALSAMLAQKYFGDWYVIRLIPYAFLLILLAVYFIEIFWYLIKHHLQILKPFFPSIISAGVFFLLFYTEVNVKWVEGRAILNYPYYHHDTSTIQYLIIHLVFWIMITLWLALLHFDNRTMEKLSKRIAFGLAISLLSVLAFTLL